MGQAYALILPLVIFLPVESETKQQHKPISGGFLSHVLLCLQPGLAFLCHAFTCLTKKKKKWEKGRPSLLLAMTDKLHKHAPAYITENRHGITARTVLYELVNC